MLERFTSATMYDPKRPRARPEEGDDLANPDDPDEVIDEVGGGRDETEENQLFTLEVFDDIEVAEIEIY